MRRLRDTALMTVALLAAPGASATAFQLAPSEPTEVAQADDDAAAPADEAAAPGANDPAFAAVMEAGETLYTTTCVGCHGAQGEGPARVFAGNENLEYIVLIASQVIVGGEFMPAFPELTDEEIAAIGTYIRNSWGNAFGIVLPEDIAQYR